jgi:hypothetical protein
MLAGRSLGVAALSVSIATAYDTALSYMVDLQSRTERPTVYVAVLAEGGTVTAGIEAARLGSKTC